MVGFQADRILDMLLSRCWNLFFGGLVASRPLNLLAIAVDYANLWRRRGFLRIICLPSDGDIGPGTIYTIQYILCRSDDIISIVRGTCEQNRFRRKILRCRTTMGKDSTNKLEKQR